MVSGLVKSAADRAGCAARQNLRCVRGYQVIGDQEGQASRREAMVQDGAGALVLACLLWAGNFIVARSMRGVIDPETLNFLRWLLACGVFLPFTIRRLRRHGATLWAYRGWLLALGLSGLVGFQQATYTALTMTPVANAVLLLATTPILIVLSSAMLGRGGLSWRQGGRCCCRCAEWRFCWGMATQWPCCASILARVIRGCWLR